jgi:uncharacterized membrane protein YbjE (DUF340 family)
MSKGIIISVILGIFAGYLLVPILPFGQAYIALSGDLVMALLCVLLFLVGFEIGRDDKIIKEVKAVGFRIFLFPLAAISGTYAFTAIASIFLPLTAREAMAVGGGFGWYSLAPTILLEYSASLSAICFLQNVLREMLGIVLIPLAAKRIGYIEAAALPGVVAADVCIPVIEKATGPHIVIYSFVIGQSMGLAVPLVGIIVGM